MTRGFTLIETLIALVIASITALVLLQSLTAIARTTMRIDGAAANALSQEFTTTAIEDALSGAIADYLNSPGVFEGDEHTLRGVTKRPLLAPYGSQRPFELQIADDGNGVRLRYRETGPSPVGDVTARWVDVLTFEDRDIRFIYAYRSLENLYDNAPPTRSDSWPPEAPFSPFYDYFRPPPGLVMIVDSEDAILWAVTSEGWQAPPLRPSDLAETL